MTAGSAVEIQQTFRAVDGVVGPRPTEYLAPSVELWCSGATLFGPRDVASALRELTAGARDIHLQVIERSATATWLLPTAGPPAIVMVDFEVDEGRVTRVTASRLKLTA